MKKIVLKILGIVIIGVILAQTNIVIAATQAEIDANNKKIQDAEKEKEQIEREKSATVKQVESLTSQISSYESQIDELENKIENLDTQISNEQEKLNKAQVDYEKKEKLLEARLVASYEAGDTSYLDVLLSSESITDFISKYYLVTELAVNDTEILEKIQKQKEEIQKAKENLENNKKEVSTAKANKQSVSTQLQTSKNEKNNYVAKLTENEKAIQREIDELKEANKRINREIEEANRKYQEELDKLKPSTSGFIKPVNSYITTGLYYSSGQYHGAVDYGASGINGAPIYAVADAVVIIAKSLTGSYGNYIILAHSNGLYTLYAHGQSGSIAVREGQTVKQGQQIMKVGTTGNSTGPHLHFEVRKNPGNYEDRVNPIPYLPK